MSPALAASRARQDASDRDVIIRSLRKIRLARYIDKIVRNTSAIACVALPVLIGFRILAWLVPLDRTVSITALIVWTLATLAALAWRLRHPYTLEQAAAALDAFAGLNDEIKSAYWFLENRTDSPWIQAQISRAARNVSLNTKALCSRSLPRSSYASAAMAVLVVIMNSYPTAGNRNAPSSQPAPSSDAESAAVSTSGAGADSAGNTDPQNGPGAEPSPDELELLSLTDQPIRTDELTAEDARDLELAGMNPEATMLQVASGSIEGNQALAPYMETLSAPLNVKLFREPLLSRPEMTAADLQPSEKENSRLLHLYPSSRPAASRPDVLLPGHIPLQYQDFVRKYFDAIREIK
jgi:hypothetical protein